jgi:hypothetical protein
LNSKLDFEGYKFSSKQTSVFDHVQLQNIRLNAPTFCELRLVHLYESEMQELYIYIFRVDEQLVVTAER